MTELVMSHFTLPRFHPIHDRVRLAAENGFDGIGLYISHYAQLEDEGFAPNGLAELLDEHGIRLREIEVVKRLGADEDDRSEVAWRMADAFGCRYLQVIGPSGPDIAAAGRVFGELCDRAADHGLVTGIEFLPFNDIYSVTDARHIVEAAGRPNGGICVDIWHHTRGADDLSAIAALPGEMITGIQLNDGTIAPAEPDYYTDCMDNRVAPGEGEFDMAGFLAAVHSTGTAAPYSLEVCSATGWQHPDDHVRRVADGIRSFM